MECEINTIIVHDYVIGMILLCIIHMYYRNRLTDTKCLPSQMTQRTLLQQRIYLDDCWEETKALFRYACSNNIISMFR